MIHIFRTCPKLLHELENLPHATTGNVEDADSKASDHAMDAMRYLLLSVGGGPRSRCWRRRRRGCWQPPASRSWNTPACSAAPSDIDALFDREDGAGTTQRSPCAWGGRLVPGECPGNCLQQLDDLARGYLPMPIPRRPRRLTAPKCQDTLA